MLKHHADLLLQHRVDALAAARVGAGDVWLALEYDLAPLNAFEPHHHAQERAFAAAARANDHEPVVRAHVQAHPVHHDKVLAVGLVDPSKLNELTARGRRDVTGVRAIGQTANPDLR
ncbi:hypothetical protein PTE30175_04209 [Pandoraea terrae]|uniref:Uncharacterized protein n=1 Tax=Pandoraea terrae TaxID=1537710 RepID=A0A5E4Y5V9_9BURK|nr:hypothetical protein PTE30175_04209 [Pandoraea terrae]